MEEINCFPLSGRGSQIHATIRKGGFCDVEWGDADFKFPYALIEGILQDVFSTPDWVLLGSYRNDPKGLGKYIQNQSICSLHSPQFASAIAPIMVKMDLIVSRKRKNSIELKKK